MTEEQNQECYESKPSLLTSVIVSNTQPDVNDTEREFHQNVNQYTNGIRSFRWARIACFLLIAIMNLSAWIDMQGLFVEIPLIVPFTPEGWTLPSTAAMCVCAANIVPVMVVVLRWHQGKRFSEIPYIYMIIIVGIVACFILALFWQQTIFLFGRERSVWLLSSIFILSMLDCTSSLVFFDYMKRLRAQYLSAVFLGEALTSAIPTLLVLAQGVGGETICIATTNGTIAEPKFTQPRFSVRVFMFCIAGIIVASLIAFVLLRWTNIIELADAAQTDPHEKVQADANVVTEENMPMVSIVEPERPSKSVEGMTGKMFTLLLSVNIFNSTISFGCLPSLSTYALLPFSQKAFYYWSLLIPMAYPFSLLLSIRWTTLSSHMTIVGSVFSCLLSLFIFVIAWQSPCPWWADTVHGAVIIITVWFLMSLTSGFLRITIGNRIKIEWTGDKGMFYFGGTAQLGLLLGTIPMYLLISVFGLFIDRKPCQLYCLT